MHTFWLKMQTLLPKTTVPLHQKIRGIFPHQRKNHFLMETNKKIANQQQTNLHFCDERVELLDTIREIVKMEVDKRIDKLKEDKTCLLKILFSLKQVRTYMRTNCRTLRGGRGLI